MSAGDEEMGTLHVVPTMSAGGSLRQAIADANQYDHVLSFSDDLSCGPINPDTAPVRAAWWASIYEEAEDVGYFEAFWNCVAKTDDRLVVWFGRHSALELAFIMSWADRLGGVSPNRRNFRHGKLNPATISSRSMVCALPRKV